MNSKTDTLPRTILGVEAWLREQARPDMAQDYPFLFGMATAKLAEAHSEIVRLRRELADAEAEADRAEHNGYCDCEVCRMDRGADTAMEGER